MTSAVTLLAPEEIELRGPVLADALRAVPGLAVSRSGPAGSLTDVRLRGSEANHVLVLIDGIEASVPFTGGFNFSQTPAFGVERVEVLRGEQSALWGSDAIGGVINILTHAGTPDTRLSAFAEAGSFETRQAGGSLSGTRGSLSGGMSASLYATEGIDAAGLGGEEDGFDLRGVSASGTLGLSLGISVEGAARLTAYTTEYDADTDFDGRLNDTANETDGLRHGARLAVIAEPGAIRLPWRSELALSLVSDVAENLDAGVFAGETEGRRWQAFYQGTANWSGWGGEHRLTVLAEHEAERFSAFSGPGAGDNQVRELSNDALAFDYSATAGRLSLHASARQDWNERFDDALTWRIGAAHAFDAVGGRLRASFGEGVKNPGIYELYGFFPGFFTGNPGLVPERSRGWEIGWDQQFGDTLRLGLSAYGSTLDDEIFTDFAPVPATARNRATQSERRGVEIEGEWQAYPALMVRGSATFSEAEENGTPEIRRPDRLASLSVTWSPVDRPFRAGFAADHVGEQTDTDFVAFTNVSLPAYTLVSGRFAWSVIDRLELYVRGDNLLDEEYRDVVGYAAPGRGLYLGLRLGH
ncbi:MULTISPECIES: TonB-dependent receptor plug domain-containing protein [Hyphobacterium]|uniref:TonB-dependent receptor plug domain-containing protein n=1 Tax=Hyphobacterium vulgare TaxID=1736751 RepID=A0ABV6ZVG4_9PROT